MKKVYVKPVITVETIEAEFSLMAASVTSSGDGLAIGFGGEYDDNVTLLETTSVWGDDDDED